MAENSENIEAKLCAYVEGDLDEQGRAEIERHLEVHPNHRRLLSELAATRELLRFLPREQAPPELAEAFNAQLERSALLDAPAADPSGDVIRANFLPRMMAMAAVLLLTVGLGVIVYFALPRGASRSDMALVDTAQPSATNTDEDVEMRAARAPSGGPTTGMSGGLLADGRSERLGKGGVPPFGVTDPSTNVASNIGPRPDIDALQQFEGKGGWRRDAQAAAEPVYVIVTALDKSDAVRETQTFLTNNQFAWTDPDEFHETNGQRENEVAATSATTQVQPQQARPLTAVASGYGRVELNNALQLKQRQQTSQYQQQANVQAPAAAAPNVAEQADAVAAGPSPEVAKKEVQEQAATPAAPAAAPNQPVASGLPTESVQTDSGDTAQVQQSQQGQQQLAAVDLAKDADVSGIKTRMTRSQLASLAQSLNRGSQRVELVSDYADVQQTVNEALQRQAQDALVQQPAEVLAEAPDVGAEAAKPDASAIAPSDAYKGDSVTRPQAKINARYGGDPTTRQSDVSLKAGPGPTTAPSRERIIAETPNQAIDATRDRGRGGVGPRPELPPDRAMTQQRQQAAVPPGSEKAKADEAFRLAQSENLSTTQSTLELEINPTTAPTTTESVEDEPLDVVILVQAAPSPTSQPVLEGDIVPSDVGDVPAPVTPETPTTPEVDPAAEPPTEVDAPAEAAPAEPAPSPQ